MNKKVLNFINSENWEEEFLDNSIDDKLSSLVKMIRLKDMEGLLSFWENSLVNDYFELPHPEYREITTRAVYNIQSNMTNFILMIDSEKQQPWILAQCLNMIDYIVTEKKLIKIARECAKYDFSGIKNLASIDVEKINYNTKFSGFLLSQIRPYHFFYDHLQYLFALGGVEKLNQYNKKILNHKAFFILDDSSISNESKGVYFFPAVLTNLFLADSKMKNILNNRMETEVFNKSIVEFTPEETSKNNLILWFGITGQKRSWLQQIEGCIGIVDNLLKDKHFSYIKLYIDGMTSPENISIDNSEDNDVFEIIFLYLKDKCEIISLIGKDYKSKIQICRQVDLFIANSGTGCLVPLRFCNKNGVLHGNTLYSNFDVDNRDMVKVAKNIYTLDVVNPEVRGIDKVSYHIPWQHIFNLAIDVLNRTKGTSIKCLAVPALEEIVLKWEIEKKVESESKSFKYLKNRITPEYKPADILRDIAIAFEMDGDIEMAKEIMYKAYILRPTGSAIKKKLDMYKQSLSKKSPKI